MHERRGPSTALAAILALAAMTGALGLAAPATAQGLFGPCAILSCDFDVTVVNWNGSGDPGTFLTGKIRIENIGQSEDSYNIAVSIDNETWTAEADPTETGMVDAGDSLLPGGDANNTEDVDIIVHIPEQALAGESVSVRVIVTSQNAEDLGEKDVSFAASALQRYAWSLSCTDEITIEKAREGTVELIATNLGNGLDNATVSTTPLAGLQVEDPGLFRLPARGTGIQEVELGAGLALEDGNYTLRWDLMSIAAPTVSADCTTTLNVTGGDEAAPDDDAEDSPMIGVLVVVLVATLIAAQRRAARRSE